jgi:hypothetical protein
MDIVDPPPFTPDLNESPAADFIEEIEQDTSDIILGSQCMPLISVLAFVSYS